MAIYKNVASQKLAVYAYDGTTAAGSNPAKTGDAANITAQISLDGGTAAATNDTNPTELEATDHPGIYVFDLTQAETNADMIVLSAVSATGNILIDPVVIYTLPEPVAVTDVVSNGAITTDGSGNLSGSVASVSGAVGSVTGNVGGNVTGSVGSLATQAKADVNAEVADVLDTDARSENIAAPADTLSLADKIDQIHQALFRKKETDGGVSEDVTIYRADGTTVWIEGPASKSGDVVTVGPLSTP